MRTFPRILAVLSALLFLGGAAAAPEKPTTTLTSDSPVIGPVDAAALPEDPAVRKAWADVVAQTPYAYYWYNEWRHPVAKEAVQKALSASLEVLKRAAKQGESRELLLALGIAGRFGHNVDLDGAAATGFEALKRAAALGGDPRAEWLLGGSYCHANETADGWPHVEKAMALAKDRKLPEAFWHDYLWCAVSGLMPAHQLRARRALEDLGALTSLERIGTEKAQGLLVEPSLTEQYPHEKTLSLEKKGTRVSIAVVPCGFRFTVEGTQDLEVAPVNKGACMVETYVGPFPGKAGGVNPGLFVIARSARLGIPPNVFIDKIAPPDRRAAVKDLPCPAARCTAYEVHDATKYENEGGGMAIVVAFERDAPELPGLLFERPYLPKDRKEGVTVMRMGERLVRFPGKVQYFVVLDTAESVADQGRAEFRRFLSELVVE